MFVDELYDAGIKLIWTSDGTPNELFENVLDNLSDESQTLRIIQDLTREVDVLPNSKKGASPSMSITHQVLITYPLSRVDNYESKNKNSQDLNYPSDNENRTDRDTGIIEAHSSSLNNKVIERTINNLENDLSDSNGSEEGESSVYIRSGEGASFRALAISCRRAISRLTEMRSSAYDVKIRNERNTST